MGTFSTSVAVMQQAVTDMAVAKSTIDRQINEIGVTAEGTLKSWKGNGGNTLRTLMAGYDRHARALQKAIATFETMLAEQARVYGIEDDNAGSTLLGAGGALRM